MADLESSPSPSPPPSSSSPSPPPSASNEPYIFPYDIFSPLSSSSSSSLLPSSPSPSPPLPVLSSITNTCKQNQSITVSFTSTTSDASPRKPLVRNLDQYRHRYISASTHATTSGPEMEMTFQRDENVVIMDGFLVKKTGTSNMKKDRHLSLINSDQNIRFSSSSSISGLIIEIPFRASGTSHSCKRSSYGSYNSSQKIKPINMDVHNEHDFQKKVLRNELSSTRCNDRNLFSEKVRIEQIASSYVESPGRYVIPQHRRYLLEVSHPNSAEKLHKIDSNAKYSASNYPSTSTEAQLRRESTTNSDHCLEDLQTYGSIISLWPRRLPIFQKICPSTTEE